MIRNIRAVTYACYTSMFLLGVSAALVGAAAKNIGLSPYQIGLLIAAQNLGFMVSVMLAGALADTHTKPRLLLVGSLVLAGAFFSFYATDLFWLNLLVMFAIGAGIGMYEGVTDALLLDIHDRRQNYYINANHFFVTVGSILIALYLTFLSINWRSAVVLAGLAALILALVFALMHVRRRYHTHEPFLDRLRILRRDRVVVALFIATVLVIGVESGTVGILTTFLVDLRGIPIQGAQIALILFLVGMAAGRLLVGYFSKDEQIVQTILGLFAVSVVVYSALYFIDLGVAALVVVALAGLSMSALIPLLLALAGRLYPAMAGTVLGATKFAMPFGGIIIPFLMSVITRTASFQASLILFPLAFLLGLLVLYPTLRAVDLTTAGQRVVETGG